MTLELDAKRIASQLDDALGDKDAYQKAIRDIFFTCQHPVVADDDHTLVAKTPVAGYLVGIDYVVETTVPAQAASLNVLFEYDDGAGGADVALSTVTDGITLAVTQDVNTPGTQTAAHQLTLIPAGSRIFATITVNGAGALWNGTLFQLRFRQQ